MPLKSLPLDLREYPLCQRPMRLLLALERMALGDALLVVDDRDPNPTFQELRPVLGNGFDCSFLQSDPQVWRILLSCREPLQYEPKGLLMDIDYKGETSLHRYLGQLRSIWGSGQDPELPYRVKGLTERLLTSASPRERWIAKVIREGPETKELYRSRQHGFIFTGHVHAKGHRTHPHDHGPCWVLYGVYHGVSEITTYRRTDNGCLLGSAILEKQQVRRLTSGSVILSLAGEIHSTFAAEPSVVFCFLSGELNQAGRYRYIHNGAGFQAQCVKASTE